MTIKNKILLWFLIPSILIATVSISICYFYVRNTVEQNIFNQLKIAADELQNKIHVFLRGKRDRVHDFSSDNFIRDITEKLIKKERKKNHYTANINTYLITKKKSLDPSIIEVFIINLNGRVIASTNESRIGGDLSSEEYFSKAEPLRAFADGPHYDRRLSGVVIDFSTVILSRAEQQPIGVIVSRIKAEQGYDRKQGSVTAQRETEVNYFPLIIAKNKAHIRELSSDSYIRDYTEELEMTEDRINYYIYQLNAYLSTYKKPLDPDILEVYVTNLNGKVICSSEIGQIGRDISSESSFLKIRARGSSIISDIHYSPEFNENTFEVLRFLAIKDGMRPIGIIINRYSGDIVRRITQSGISEEFSELMQQEGLGETGELYVVNRDKLMITESRFIKDVILKKVVNTEGVRSALDNGVGMIGIYPDYRGIPILGVSIYFKEMDWIILAEKDVSEAFAPIVRLRNVIITMGIIGIMAIVVIAVFLSNGIAKCIKKLLEGTQRIVKSDLDHPIVITKMKGEIKELAESFNLMMNKLKKSNEKNTQLFLEVKRSRDEWQNTFDAITDIITIHDKDFRILNANKAFLKRFSINKEQLSNMRCNELFHCNDKHWQSCPLAKSTTTQKPEIGEVNAPNLDGVFLAYTYPIRDERDEIHSFVLLTKDITFQKRLQRQLIVKAKKLEMADKDLEKLANIVSELDNNGKEK
ncbi:MAG: PAS domain-containing protein [Candidatus Scalinduaceae bacterium]